MTLNINADNCLITALDYKGNEHNILLKASKRTTFVCHGVGFISIHLSSISLEEIAEIEKEGFQYTKEVSEIDLNRELMIPHVLTIVSREGIED